MTGLSRIQWVGILIGAWLIVTFLAFNVARGNIEPDLKKRTLAYLQQQGTIKYKAEVEGQDVTLYPAVQKGGPDWTTENEMILNAADKLPSEVPGIRKVNVVYPGSTPSGTHSEVQTAWFRVERFHGETTLRGDFASAGEREQTSEYLQDLYGAFQVKMLATVDERRRTNLDPVVFLRKLPWLKSTEDFDLEYDGRNATIGGSVQSQKAREWILNSLRRALPKTAKLINEMDPNKGTKKDSDGPTVAVETAHAVSDFDPKHTMNTDRFFVMGTAQLTGAGKAFSNEVAGYLEAHPKAKLALHLHTHRSKAPAKDNQICALRVEALKSYLVTQGVDASRLKAISHGSKVPVALNTTEEGKKKNRRLAFRTF